MHTRPNGRQMALEKPKTVCVVCITGLRSFVRPTNPRHGGIKSETIQM